MAELSWNGRNLTIKRGEYQYGSCKQLAILCFDNTDPECSEASGCPYGVLTVNLDDARCEPLGDDSRYATQFLDVNNWPGIEKVLADCDWAQPIDASLRSGFVEYPIWIFDTKKIPHI